MKRLLSFRAAFVLSALVLLAGWQASVPGQDSDGYGGEQGVLVPLNAAWEFGFPELLKLLEAKPADLNPQQLRILDGGLESKTESLTQQYADATDEAQRKKLESELAEVVGQHFAVRQAIRDREIAELEKEVARLRELLEQRENAKQQIVQGRVDQLIRSAKGLGWDGKRATTAVPGRRARPAVAGAGNPLPKPRAPVAGGSLPDPFEADATPGLPQTAPGRGEPFRR